MSVDVRVTESEGGGHWSLALVALLVTLAFGGGYYAGRPHGEPASVAAARAATIAAEARADSAERARTVAIAATDLAAGRAAVAERAAILATRATRAYRDSVRALGDSLLIVVHPASPPETVAVPAAVVARLAADSAALALADAERAARTSERVLWLSEREAAREALRAARSVAATLRAEIRVRESAAYARGARAARVQIVAGIGAGAVAYLGVRAALR